MEILESGTVTKPYTPKVQDSDGGENTEKKTIETEYKTLKLTTPSHVADTLINNFQSKLKLPGFRAGKVPRPVLERRFGKDAIYGQFIHDAWIEHLLKNQMLVTNDAEISDINVRLDDSLSFTSTFLSPNLLPNIKLKDKYEVDVLPDILKEAGSTIQQIRAAGTKRIEVEDLEQPSMWGNEIVFSHRGRFTDAKDTDEEGNIKFNPIFTQDNITAIIGSGVIVINEIEQALTNMKVDETKSLTCNMPENLGELLPNNPSATEMAGKEVYFELDLHKIFTLELPTNKEVMETYLKKELAPLTSKSKGEAEMTDEEKERFEKLSNIDSFKAFYTHLADEIYARITYDKIKYVKNIITDILEEHKEEAEASISVAMLDFRIDLFLNRYQAKLEQLPAEKHNEVLDNASKDITNGIFEDIVLYSLMPLYSEEIKPSNTEIKGRQQAMMQLVKQGKVPMQETNFWACYKYIQEYKLKEKLADLLVLKFDKTADEFTNIFADEPITESKVEDIIEATEKTNETGA